MPLTPEEIEAREFVSTLRGFDRDEVTEFLHNVADHVRALEADLAAAHERPAGTVAVEAPAPDPLASVGIEISEILRSAQTVAEGMRATAEEEARAAAEASQRRIQDAHQAADLVRAEAEAAAAHLRDEARVEAGRITGEARTAMMAAEAEAATVIADARRRADELVVDATRRQDQVRAAHADAERALNEAATWFEGLRSALGDVRSPVDAVEDVFTN